MALVDGRGGRVYYFIVRFFTSTELIDFQMTPRYSMNAIYFPIWKRRLKVYQYKRERKKHTKNIK